MSPVEAKPLVQALAAAWRLHLGEETAALYIRFLSDIPPAVGRRAAEELIATKTFFPRIAEFRAACRRKCADGLAPSPAEAWLEVMEQLEAVGFSRPPRFSHPLVQRAVRAIGWRALGESTAIGVERGHFLQIYQTLLEREEKDAARLPESISLFLPSGRDAGRG